MSKSDYAALMLAIFAAPRISEWLSIAMCFGWLIYFVLVSVLEFLQEDSK